MTTFKRFTELPRELRDRIWRLAIRDDHPGVHIFGQYVTGRHRIQFCGGTSFDLVAPSWRRYFESLDEYHSDENISTYLLDSGLWTACHESRCIVEKHFKHSERQVTLRRPNDHQRSFSEKELSEMATSGYFGGTPLEIVTVFPHRDLFVLQHNDLDKIDWGCLGFEASLALPREGFSGVDHVGIEYDRAWGDGYCIDEDVNCTFLNACVEANYTIWFIDRYLKRKSQGPAFKEESDCSWKINAFYASDRKLLEIKDYDDLFKDWEYIGPMETEWYDHMHHSLSFVRQLRADLTDQYITNDCEAEKPCVIGLLGWAPL